MRPTWRTEFPIFIPETRKTVLKSQRMISISETRNSFEKILSFVVAVDLFEIEE
jgi:hypothetical protein